MMEVVGWPGQEGKEKRDVRYRELKKGGAKGVVKFSEVELLRAADIERRKKAQYRTLWCVAWSS